MLHRQRSISFSGGAAPVFDVCFDDDVAQNRNFLAPCQLYWNEPEEPVVEQDEHTGWWELILIWDLLLTGALKVRNIIKICEFSETVI